MAYEYFTTSWGYRNTLTQLQSFLQAHWQWDSVQASSVLTPTGSSTEEPYLRFYSGNAYLEITSTKTSNTYFRNFFIKVYSNGTNRGTVLQINGGYYESGTNYCHLYKNDNGIILAFDWAPASASASTSS